MVKITRFTAVNPVEIQDEAVSTTLEAEESAVIELYESGIRAVFDGKHSDAEDAFRSVLSNDLVTRGATEQLQRLRVLSIKNLAITVSKQEGRNKDALILFQEAIAGDPRDISLIDKFGTIAAREGEWNASKDAFFSGLKMDASHLTLKRKLYDILEHLNDHNTCLRVSGTQMQLEHATRRIFDNLPEHIKCGPQASVIDGPPVVQKMINVKDWIGLLLELGRLIDEHGSHCLVAVQVDKEEQVNEHASPVQRLETNDTSVIAEGSISAIEELSSNDARRLGQGLLFDSWKSFILPLSASSMDMVHAEHEDEVTLFSVPKIHNVSLDACTSTVWPLLDLCEVALMYFLGSEELRSLSKDSAASLINVIEHVDLHLPLEYMITLAEWLTEQFSMMKEDYLSDISQSKTMQDEMEKLDALSEKMLLRVAIEADSVHWGSKEEEKRFRVRFLFAQGKKMQVLDKPDRAKEYLSACLNALEDSDFGIRLLHVNNENIITFKRVKFNLESVDIHSEIQNIKVHPLEENRDNDRLVSLTEKVLSGQRAESFMMSVDPLGWSCILRELIDAAIKSNDYKTCIRCQIRLLFANLPDVHDVENSQKNQLEFLQPLFTTTFMNFIMNSVQIEKVLYKNIDAYELEEYERNMLRSVLSRLLVIMDASHELLVTDESNPKAKYFKVLLSHATAFFLAFLSLDSCRNKDVMFIEQLELLFNELGRLGLLLQRNSLIPYFSLPLLGQILSRISSKNCPALDLLVTQMEHMVMFSFGVSLTAHAAAGNFHYVDSVATCMPRGVTQREELLFVWPLCENYLSLLSNQMLRKRAHDFIQKCYGVALSLLPKHVQTSMLTSIEKCALYRPQKVCSGDDSSVFSYFNCSEMLDPHSRMNDEDRESLLKVFKGIFDLKVKVEPLDTVFIQKQDDVDPLKVSDKSLEENTHPYIWNLAFNPDAIEHWQVLAEFHQSMYEWILNTCLTDGRNPSKQESFRLVRHRNISYWCSYIACKAADEKWKDGRMQSVSEVEAAARVFEFHGHALMNEVTRLQFDHVDDNIGNEKVKIVIRENLEKACAAYIGATRFAPLKYSNHMLLGVCMKRLGYSGKVFMQRLVDACKLARQEYGAVMDPLFELHASRMDMLESIWDPRTNELNSSAEERREVLEICSQTGFSEAGVSELPPGEVEKIKMLHADSVEAMEWCLEVDKYFYKAIMQLAMSKSSDVEIKYKYLNVLFTKGSQNFVINVWPVREKGPHVARNKGKKRKVNDSEVPFFSQDQAEHHMLEGPTNLFESNTRKPNVKSVGIGMNQIDTMDNHQLCITRNALLAYIVVLKESQRIEVLHEVQDFLEHVEDSIFRVPEYQEIITLCKVSEKFVSLAYLDSIIPSDMESMVDLCRSLARAGEMPSILFQCNESMSKRLKFALDLYMMYLTSSRKVWIESIVHPVAKYMLWRQSEGDTSDDTYAKVLVTKKGTEILGIYSSVYVKLLEAEVKYKELLDLYEALLSMKNDKVSVFGMTLCISALPAIKIALTDFMKRHLAGGGEGSTDENMGVEHYNRIVNIASAALVHAKDIASCEDLDDILKPMQQEIKEKAIGKLKLVIQQSVHQQRRFETKKTTVLEVQKEDAPPLASLEPQGNQATASQEKTSRKKKQQNVKKKPSVVDTTPDTRQENGNDDERQENGNDDERQENGNGRPATAGIAAMAIQALFSQPK